VARQGFSGIDLVHTGASDESDLVGQQVAGDDPVGRSRSVGNHVVGMSLEIWGESGVVGRVKVLFV
jgi:hypothetical protein